MLTTIALIAGSYLTVTAAGFLLQPDFYRSMVSGQADTDPVTLNLSGACHFIVGMVVVINVASFSSFDEGAVTLLGIATAMKGGFLIALPLLASRPTSTTTARIRGIGVGFAAAGLLFLWIALF